MNRLSPYYSLPINFFVGTGYQHCGERKRERERKGERSVENNKKFEIEIIAFSLPSIIKDN